MKCREAHYWLYSFRPNASWPVDVVAHLQQCPKCQQLQTQLKQIDHGVDKLTKAPGSSTAVAQLLERVAKTPQTAVTTPRITPSSTLPWMRLTAYLVGSAALVLIGWFLGRLGDKASEGPVEPRIITEFKDRIQERIVEVHSSADRLLFSKLLTRNARLVQATQNEDRLEVLLDMADDCRQHAWLLLAEKGPRDSLPLTIDLYGQLLREGVLAQLAQSAPAALPGLQMATKSRLKKMAEVPADARAPAGALAEQHEALQHATDETLRLVDDPGKAPAAGKARSIEALTPAATLVRFAVTVSSETDPVIRADLCSSYVKRLLPTMNLYLTDDGAPRRAEMGQQFGELIQFGVYRPLELAKAEAPALPLKAEAERIEKSADEAIASMEKSLEKAPQEARQGFQKAIEATRTSKGKGKGKGPRDIHGSLQNINPAAGTVTVNAKIQGKDSLYTFALSKEFLTSITGKTAPRPEWRTGASVHLRLSDDRRTVIEIRTSQDDGQKNQK